MKFVYTAKEITGRWPEHPRIARETLIAVIEDGLIPNGLVDSYNITDSEHFPFPHRFPFFSDLPPDFFKEHVGIYTKIKELKDLYQQKGNKLFRWYNKLETDHGFWIARLVAPDKPVEGSKNKGHFKTVEDALKFREMPYCVSYPFDV